MAVETLPLREQVHVSGLVEKTRRLQSDNNRLEQELERLGEKNVELAFQLVEMETRLRNSADLQIVHDYRARVEELEKRLQIREERIRELEAMLQRIAVPAEKPVTAQPDTTAGLLARRLEPLLGAASSHLVERIFQRAEVAFDCRDASEVEPALNKLQEAAGRLLAAPERAEELRQTLDEVRRDLGRAPVIARREPKPEKEKPALRLRFAPPPGPVAREQDEPWRYPETPPPEEFFRTDFDPELCRDVALAREQLHAAEYALALETVLPLRSLYPHSLEAAEVQFLALAGLRRHGEALELGRRLAPQCRSDEPFVEAFTRVLEDTHGKSAQERKQALLDLVELHLEDNQRALGYLRQAELLPDRCPGCERLDFHAVNLLSGGRADRRPYLLDSMSNLDRPEVFEHLWQVYQEPRSAHEASTARAIVAVGKVGRNLAENSEKQARLLARQPLTALEEAGELEETACVRFLNMLFERASLGPARPSAAFLRLLESGHTPEPGWLSLPDFRLLGLAGLQVARCSGPFLVDAHRDEAGQVTLLVHECVGGLPESEQAYLLHRALYQVARGHSALRHRIASLTTGHVRRLVQACRGWLQDRALTLPEPVCDPLEDLRALCLATRSHEAGYLLELLTNPHAFADVLDRPADSFARRHSSLTGASYALLREHAPELLPQVEREGFRVLYDKPELRSLRLRLQRMWAEPLRQSLKG